MSLLFFSPFCSENRFGRFKFCPRAENCFDAGILLTGDNFCNIEIYSKWFSCSTRHSLYSSKNLLGGSEPLLFVTMEILDSSPLNAHADTSEQLPQIKDRGHPCSNDVPVSLHPNALPLCQVSLSILPRQSTLFLLVYKWMVRKCSSLMWLCCFSLSCSECRLRRFRLFSNAKNCFDAGTSHTADQNCTARLCCR